MVLRLRMHYVNLQSNINNIKEKCLRGEGLTTCDRENEVFCEIACMIRFELNCNKRKITRKVFERGRETCPFHTIHL